MGAPPAAVLAAYGLAGTPERLPGGQGTSWRVGRAVLEPEDAPPAYLAWRAGVLERLAGRADVRAVPLRTSTGGSRRTGGPPRGGSPARRPRDGGGHRRCRAPAARRTGGRAAAGRAGAAHRPVGGRRPDRLGRAAAPDAGPRLAPLAAAREPVHLPSQLVHGLTGNVLLADGLAPLALDLSPYWRPVEYATAVVVADGGPAELGDGSDWRQLVLRARLFRAVTGVLRRG